MAGRTDKAREARQECRELNLGRERMYCLLGRFFRSEADGAMLDMLSGMAFPKDGPEELRTGYGELSDFLAAQRGTREEVLEALAVDYARVFLGAGVVNYDAAYPYESVYTSAKKLIMQEARDEVVALYRASGLEAEAGLDVPEDHMAVELSFMAFLCREAAGCRGKAAQELMRRQQEFLERHLLRWGDDFGADILKYAATGFYRGAAHILRGYLAMERALIEERLLCA